MQGCSLTELPKGRLHSTKNCFAAQRFPGTMGRKPSKSPFVAQRFHEAVGRKPPKSPFVAHRPLQEVGRKPPKSPFVAHRPLQAVGRKPLKSLFVAQCSLQTVGRNPQIQLFRTIAPHNQRLLQYQPCDHRADLADVHIRLEVEGQSCSVGEGQHQFAVDIQHSCSLDAEILHLGVRI